MGRAGGRAFATAAARQRRAVHHRQAVRFEREVRALLADTDMTRTEAVAYLSDLGNRTMCERCGWSYNMVCPECEQGCGCSTGCDGWRHGEYDDDDGDSVWFDAEECEGCGAGGPYNCVCYHRSADEADDGPERDYWQEWKDDSMQREQTEPDEVYLGYYG